MRKGIIRGGRAWEQEENPYGPQPEVYAEKWDLVGFLVAAALFSLVVFVAVVVCHRAIMAFG